MKMSIKVKRKECEKIIEIIIIKNEKNHTKCMSEHFYTL